MPLCTMFCRALSYARADALFITQDNADTCTIPHAMVGQRAITFFVRQYKPAQSDNFLV